MKKLTTILTGTAVALTMSAAAARAERGTDGELKIIYWQAVSILNPYLSGGTKDVHGSSLVLEPLAKYDETGTMVPALVDEIPTVDNGGVAEDLKSITWTISEGLKWSDGTPFTANDVVFTWKYCTAPDGGCQQAEKFTDIASVEAVDDRSVKVTYTVPKPFPYGPFVGAESPVIQEAQFKDCLGPKAPECTEQNFHPIGTGPFRVVHFDPGRRLELERAPSYWRPGLPRSRALVFHFGASPAEIRSGFEAGRFSIAGEMVPEDVEALRRDPVYASGYRENPSFATYFIACNVHRGPLADRALRRQIAEAIDRPRLARQTLGRLVKPAQGLIPPGLLGYEAETGSSVAPVDTPQAGLRDIELNCLVHSVFLSEYRAYFRRLCETLAVLGIRLKVLEGYHNLYDLPEPEKKLDLTITRWFGDFPDAHTFCGTLHTREGVFGPLVGSERFDKLLEKGQVTADPQARHAIYRQIDELIADEACIIPLFHPQTYRFARPEVEGLAVSHDGPVVAYEELSLRGDEG